MMITYLKSKPFKTYLPDWILSIITLIYFFLIAEKAKPFKRQFKLNDYTIQHPFTINERVTGIQCILLASLIPFITIFIIIFIKYRIELNDSNNNGVNGKLSKYKLIHLFQISILGLISSISINGVFTDILKNWIAKPRPDFLQRCGPLPDIDPDVFVDASICTAPFGDGLLLDGMRSTPSGHSSIIWSGCLYLTLWLFGQFKLFSKIDTTTTTTTTNNSNNNKRQLIYHPIYKYILCCLPILLCFYVALSRVQDYRHHFTDIILGSFIGISFSCLFYLKYFNSIFHEFCNKSIDYYEDDSIETLLPIYNSSNSIP